MSRPVRHPFEVAWHCMNCGAKGLSWGHNEERMKDRVRRHHKIKSPACRFRKDDVIQRPARLAA